MQSKSTMVAAKSDIRYRIHTDRGTYHFYEMGEQEHQLLAGMKPDDKEYGDNAVYHHYDYKGNKHARVVEKGNYLGFFGELANAIRNGGKPPVTAEEQLRVIQLFFKVPRGCVFFLSKEVAQFLVQRGCVFYFVKRVLRDFGK